jgi:hypothetical protein
MFSAMFEALRVACFWLAIWIFVSTALGSAFFGAMMLVRAYHNWQYKRDKDKNEPKP